MTQSDNVGANDAPDQAVPIQEAAVRLGLSIEAVRKRARRGSLTATKIDGHWFIALPDDGPDVLDGTPHAARDGTSPRPAALPANNADVLQARVAEIEAHNRTLLAQIAIKDRQLEQAEVERAELRRLLGNAQMQIAAEQEHVARLLPGAPAPSDPPPPDEADPPPVMPNASYTGTERVPEASQKQRWPWWMRLLGGK